MSRFWIFFCWPCLESNLLSIFVPIWLWLSALTLMWCKFSFISTNFYSSRCLFPQHRETGHCPPQLSPFCLWVHSTLFKKLRSLFSRLHRIPQTFFSSARPLRFSRWASLCSPGYGDWMTEPPRLAPFDLSEQSLCSVAPWTTEIRPLPTPMPSPTICSFILASCPCEQRFSGPEETHTGDDRPTLRIALFYPFYSQLLVK